MSIRLKTIVIFLLCGVIPFMAIGTLVFVDFQKSLRGSAFSQLEAVTSLQQARVHDLLTLYADGAKRLSQQPALRQAVQGYLKNSNTRPALHQAIIATQTGGTPGRLVVLEDVSITDPDGNVLDSSAVTLLNARFPVTPDQLLADYFTTAQGVYLRFGAPLTQDNGTVLAWVYITVGGAPLSNIATSREGLGRTGETFLVKRLNASAGLFVTPLRFDPRAAFVKQVSLDLGNRPSVHALLERSATFTDGVVSYRNESVIAVAKYLPEAGLGLVGQIDQSEVYGPAKRLLLQVGIFAVLLIAFTIFVASLMARLFSKPLENLAGAAQQLRHGNFAARAKVWSNDEVGQLGRAFNSMAEDLAKQDQAKSDIIALISHQLRTPLTAVKGFISLALKPGQAKHVKEETKLLRLAFAETEKLNKLITQILEAAHTDADQVVLTKTNTDLGQLATTVVRDHRPMFDLRGQKVGLSLPDTPVRVPVDDAKLQFALGNLLSNASKYSPPGAGIAVAVGSDKHYAWLRVTDSGKGISRANQQKLFKKFSRLPGSATSEGMGLGLYLAKKIVDVHGGTLVVESSENHGSSFTIELPTKS